MTITIDDEKLVQYAKNTAILLVIAFVITFLALSSKVFHFSVDNPTQYEFNYKNLSMPEKGVATSMRVTGEYQSKVIGKNRGSGKGGSKFFETVEKIHKTK